MGLRWAMFDGTAGSRQFRRNHKPPVLAQAAADSHAPGGLKFGAAGCSESLSHGASHAGGAGAADAQAPAGNPPLPVSHSGWRLTLTSLVAY